MIDCPVNDNNLNNQWYEYGFGRFFVPTTQHFATPTTKECEFYMPKFIDLTGQKFHHLTVIERADDYVSPKGQHQTCWRCRCDCGNETVVTTSNLRREKKPVISCGCIQSTPVKDLVGMRFGKLVVLERAEDYIVPGTGAHEAAWKCQCDCGNTTIVNGRQLKQGKTKSCGCIISKPAEDLTGRTFGKLTVLERMENKARTDGKSVVQWKVRCTCGRELVVGRTKLTCNKVPSCGWCQYDERYGDKVKNQNGSGVKLIDLTGWQVGPYTVLERGPDHVCPNGYKEPKWWCRCACGNVKLMSGRTLRSNRATTCTCGKNRGTMPLTSESIDSTRIKDLTGKTFGKLTVMELADPIITKNGGRKIAWKCRCECGREKIVRATDLSSGNTQSCGQCKCENHYTVFPDHVIGETNTGATFLIDPEDYEKVKDYYWRFDGYNGYIETFIKTTRVPMHRFIMGAGEGDVVDHLNHDQTDNRKANLRIVTPLENAINRKRRADNTSGCTGVRRNTGCSTWTAEITVNKQRIRLGSFATFEEAVAARKAAEEKYFGAYSYDNSIEAVPRVERKETVNDGAVVGTTPSDASIAAAESFTVATPMPTQAVPVLVVKEAPGHQPSALMKEESPMEKAHNHHVHSIGRTTRLSSTTI